jgi:sugar (pentulose or hexulose) kinase
MTEILLVDFGASRVKAVLVDIGKRNVIDAESCISPSTQSCSDEKNVFEVPIEKYWEALLKTAGKILARHPKNSIKSLWMCAEMHGFVLTKLNGEAITPYISWKDQRANFDDDFDAPTIARMREELPTFSNITGMNVKSGLPALTLGSLARSKKIKELTSDSAHIALRALSIVDWLLFRGGEKQPKTNLTLAAGLGIYDIVNRGVSQTILECESLRTLPIQGLQIQHDISRPLGQIQIFNSLLPIYGGIGDFQAAIHGAGFHNTFDAVLNLGTGSQVVVKAVDPLANMPTEVRIMADGGYTRAITHIPCGRALNVCAAFFDSISFAGGGKSIFWDVWASLSHNKVLECEIVSNLALFESAWGSDANYSNGWIGLSEGASSVTDVIASIAKAWLIQYSKALKIIDPKVTAKKVIVCGGVGQKSQFVIPALRALMPDRDFYLASSLTGEETLDGLMRLALKTH